MIANSHMIQILQSLANYRHITINGQLSIMRELELTNIIALLINANSH